MPARSSARRFEECARLVPLSLRRARHVLLPAVVGMLLLAAPAFAITGTNDPTALANAALRDPGLLTGAVFDVPANPNATAVATENVAGFPEQGSDYLVLSSGDATLAPNASQTPFASVNNAGGTRGSAQNVVALRLNLDVPAGANCVSLKFRFFSEEYPQYVGQGFNDGFLAEMDPSTPWTMTNHQITAPDNFAFMPGGAFVSINSAPMTAANAAGTVYGGGTQPLSASTAVTPGAHALVLSVWDDGDTSYDSAAFVDDIRAFTAGPGGCAEGSVVTPVDNTPPDTTITADPGAGSGSATSFSFTSNEAGSSFECRLDGGSWDPCPSPDALSGLSAGPHTFEVRATDAAANVDPTPASHTWTVNTTTADTMLSGGPSGTTQDTSAEFGFSSDDPDATFECQLDLGPWTPCTTPDTSSGLPDGEHTYSVRAVNALGNADPTPASRSWTVDTTPPDTSIDTGPAAPTSDNSASFTFSADEDDSTFECRLDDGAWLACTSAETYNDLADSPHTLQVRATDPAGNLDPTAAERSWTVDTTPPDTSLSGGPSGTTQDTSATFGLSADDAGATFECQLDSDPWAPCTDPDALTGLGDGDHTYSVRALDALGNTDATPATRTWTVDTTPPDTSISGGPSAPTSDTSATFGFSADETDSTFECRLDDDAWLPCTSAQGYSGLADGDHTFSVRATDPTGNLDPTPAEQSWTVDTVAPDTTISGGPAGVTQSTSADFGLTSDKAGSTFECQLDAGPWESCTTPDALTGLDDGDHTFSVRATDSRGNVDPTPASVSWLVDTAAPDAPVIELTSAPAPRSNNPDPAIAFTGEPRATFECRLDGGAWSTCQSPDQLTGLADGPHTLEIRQTDEAGHTSPTAEHSWNVDTTAPAAPAILSGPASSTTDTTARFALAGEPDATIECRVDGGAWHVCPGSVDLGDLALGDHMLQVRQTDAAGNVSPIAERRWTVVARHAPADRPANPPAPPVRTLSLTGSVGGVSRGGRLPNAVSEGGLIPTGCSLNAGMMTRCMVEVRVGGHVVGRGTATFGSNGVPSGRVRVHLYPGMRARLARSHRKVTATFVFTAAVRGRRAPMVARRKVVLAARNQWILPSDGLFKSRSALLLPRVHRYLRSLVPDLRSAKAIRCIGHTDSLGTRAANHRLGLRRARAVCRQLRRLGVRAHLVAVSKGETRPRSSNATFNGRRNNRRVELYVKR